MGLEGLRYLNSRIQDWMGLGYWRRYEGTCGHGLERVTTCERNEIREKGIAMLQGDCI